MTATSPIGEGRDAYRSGAERRQLTVMFRDLVGPMGLSGQLDPEELNQVEREYHSACGRLSSAKQAVLHAEAQNSGRDLRVVHRRVKTRTLKKCPIAQPTIMKL
jgi:hypothetical protein